MATQQHRAVRLMNAITAASASAVYETDFRWPHADCRTIFGRIDGSPGATVNIWGYGNRDDEVVPVLLSAFTTSAFVFPITHPVAKIKIEKIGATGTVWVDGIL